MLGEATSVAPAAISVVGIVRWGCELAYLSVGDAAVDMKSGLGLGSRRVTRLLPPVIACLDVREHPVCRPC